MYPPLSKHYQKCCLLLFNLFCSPVISFPAASPSSYLSLDYFWLLLPLSQHSLPLFPLSLSLTLPPLSFHISLPTYPHRLFLSLIPQRDDRLGKERGGQKRGTERSTLLFQPPLTSFL
eukprot:Sspe_Gene.63251::Locus_36070_Transcript_1_1_Confidence_1.000_Length_765::g.63251::m.63251